jgi:hypothetical protein
LESGFHSEKHHILNVSSGLENDIEVKHRNSAESFIFPELTDGSYLEKDNKLFCDTPRKLSWNRSEEGKTYPLEDY